MSFIVEKCDNFNGRSKINDKVSKRRTSGREVLISGKDLFAFFYLFLNLKFLIVDGYQVRWLNFHIPATG